MGKKKGNASLLNEMLKKIAVPVTGLILLSCLVIFIVMRVQVSGLSDKYLESTAGSGANSIQVLIEQYLEVANQMSANSQMSVIMKQTKAKDDITKISGYKAMLMTMNNIYKQDSDNIVSAWVVDLDSSQMITTQGYQAFAGEWNMESTFWYTVISETGKSVITEPSVDFYSGQTVIAFAAPVYDTDGTWLGVTGINVLADRLSEAVGTYTLGSTGYYMLTTKAGYILYYPDKQIQGLFLQNSGLPEAFVESVRTKGETSLVHKNENHTKVHSYSYPIGDTGWKVTASMPNQEYASTYNVLCVILLIIYAVVLAVNTVLIIRAAKRIIDPLKNLNDAAGKIAAGDLELAIEIQSENEIGMVAASLQKTVFRLKEYIVYIEEIASVLNQIANGNFVYELKQDYAGDFSKIKAALERISAELRNTMQQISGTSGKVRNGAENLSAASTTMAQGATEQASAVEEITAMITSLTEQAKDNSATAGEAGASMHEAEKTLHEGVERVEQMVRAMQDITEVSGKIQGILQVIEEVADQTNLLALNASIEAARAGEAGRGFGVIAGEVGQLAENSAASVKSTRELIEQTLALVNSGNAIAYQTKQAMEEAAATSKNTVGLVEQLGTAAEEQAASMDEIEKGISQISAIVENNAATAQETSATSDELTGQIEYLDSLIQHFKFD